jgi:hypothetical protein
METTMRLVVFSVFLILGVILGAALSVTSRVAAEERSQALPEIVIGGGGSNAAPAANGAAGASAPAAGTIDRCVEVEIGSSKSMDCLNEQLKREVDRVNPTVNLPPIDARSPDTEVGVINIPSVHQQYGRNFGVSAVPFRPAPLVFPPLGGRH